MLYLGNCLEELPVLTQRRKAVEMHGGKPKEIWQLVLCYFAAKVGFVGRCSY